MGGVHSCLLRSPVWRASRVSGRGEAASRGNCTPLVTKRSLSSRPRPLPAGSEQLVCYLCNDWPNGSSCPHQPSRPPDLLQFPLTAQMRSTAVVLHLLNYVVMSSCGEAIDRRLGSWVGGRRGGGVFFQQNSPTVR